jgi:type II secretory pathway component PulF
VPESDAVRFAGTASGNEQFAQVAGEIANDLKAGATLPDALARIDPAEEFKWRWNIAAQSGVPFEVALEGWHETLNARAVQNETGVANLSTTILILMNGVIVGLIVVGVFQFMTGIIEEALLW